MTRGRSSNNSGPVNGIVKPISSKESFESALEKQPKRFATLDQSGQFAAASLFILLFGSWAAQANQASEDTPDTEEDSFYLSDAFTNAYTDMPVDAGQPQNGLLYNWPQLQAMGFESKDQIEELRSRYERRLRTGNIAHIAVEAANDFDFRGVNLERGRQYVTDRLKPTGDARFDQAVKVILKAEGGYVDNPNDRGGKTNFGISAKNNPGVDVENLTVNEAVQIYKANYWDTIRGIDSMDQSLALAVFDASVNHGPGYANKLVREMEEKGILNDPAKAVAYTLNTRAAKYERIIDNDPSQEVFRKGWNNRLENLQNTIMAQASGAELNPEVG